MINDIKEFIKNKTGQQELADDLGYVCQAGSFIAGTNDETSDLDYRGIVFLSDDYLLGLKKFDHTKLVGGKNKINEAEDFDIELFSPHHFLKELYYGEIIPFEMLYVSDIFRLHCDMEYVQPLLDNRQMFLSKGVVRRYISFIKACKQRSLVSVENLRRVDKMTRTHTYGYETKEAMNSIKCSRLMLELLGGQEPKLYREDREELLAIKRGKYTKEDYISLIAGLVDELESKLEKNTDLPKDPDFNQCNTFIKDYMRAVYNFQKG